MRGFESKQEGLFSYVSPQARVPADHPLRAIRIYADEALRRMGRVFNAMYADSGRLSVPPETLLKSSLLMALYSDARCRESRRSDAPPRGARATDCAFGCRPVLR